VVLSSCTNYDDQFDDLNAQINTLKSQIEGFSSLSTGLTALQGTVASLQTAINSIDIPAATDISGLESSLVDLAADLAQLKLDLAAADTSEAIADIQAELVKVQSDLTDLLASNNVYTPDVTNGLVINSAASLAVAKSLGSKLSIVNGSVTITNSTAAGLNAADLQEVLDQMVTVTGNVTYTQSGEGPSVDFDALTSVADLTLDAEHDLSLANLSNVGVLTVENDNKVTSFSAPKLVSVEKFNDGTSDHKLTLSRATSIDLSALSYYDATTALEVTGNALSAGWDLDMPLFQTKTSEGVTRGSFTLTIGGYVNLIELDAMTSSVDVIAAPLAHTIVLDSFGGSVTGNHVDVTLGAAKSDYTGGNRLEKAMITGVLTSSATTANAAEGPTFDFTGAAKLTTATIAGEADSVDFSSNTSVETVVVSANSVSVDFNGATSLTTATVSGNTRGDIDFTGATSLTEATLSGSARDVTFSGNTALTSLTMTGSANQVVITGASVLTSADLAYTTATELDQTKGTALAATAQAGSLHVYDNAELVTLAADKIATMGSLRVYNNENLTSVSFDGISAPAAAYTGETEIWIGATTSASTNAVTVDATSKNKLFAQSIVETESVDLADGSDRATATITTDSGLADLAAMITAARADAKNDVAVFFDGIDSYTTLAGVTTVDRTYANDAAKVQIANFATLTNGTAVAGLNIQNRIAEGFDQGTGVDDADDITLTYNGISKIFDASTYDDLDAYYSALKNDSGIPNVTINVGDLDANGYVTTTAATVSESLTVKVILGSTAKTSTYTGTGVEFVQVSYNPAFEDAGLQAGELAALLNGSNGKFGVYTSTHTFSSTTLFSTKYFAYADGAKLAIQKKKNVGTTAAPVYVVDRTASAPVFMAYSVAASTGAADDGDLAFSTYYSRNMKYIQIVDGTVENAAFDGSEISGNSVDFDATGTGTSVAIAASTAYTSAGVASNVTSVPYASNLTLAAEVYTAGATSNARLTVAAADVYFNTTYYTWN